SENNATAPERGGRHAEGVRSLRWPSTRQADQDCRAVPDISAPEPDRAIPRHRQDRPLRGHTPEDGRDRRHIPARRRRRFRMGRRSGRTAAPTGIAALPTTPARAPPAPALPAPLSANAAATPVAPQIPRVGAVPASAAACEPLHGPAMTVPPSSFPPAPPPVPVPEGRER